MNQSLTRHKWEPYLWLLPSLILMGIFLVYPIMIVFKLSFSEISRSGVVGGFNGLKNYITAVTAPEFGSVMINTLIWVVSVVGLSTLIGFICALVLNQRFRGRKIARSIMVFPWAASLVIQASVWNYIIKLDRLHLGVRHRDLRHGALRDVLRPGRPAVHRPELL